MGGLSTILTLNLAEKVNAQVDFHYYAGTSSAVLVYELPKYNIEMVLQTSCFVIVIYYCDGQFSFQPRTQIVNRYGHWAIFGFSSFYSVMHEVFFFPFQERELD